MSIGSHRTCYTCVRMLALCKASRRLELELLTTFFSSKAMGITCLQVHFSSTWIKSFPSNTGYLVIIGHKHGGYI